MALDLENSNSNLNNSNKSDHDDPAVVSPSMKSFCSSDSPIVRAMTVPLDKMPTGLSGDFNIDDDIVDVPFDALNSNSSDYEKFGTDDNNNIVILNKNMEPEISNDTTNENGDDNNGNNKNYNGDSNNNDDVLNEKNKNGLQSDSNSLSNSNSNSPIDQELPYTSFTKGQVTTIFAIIIFIGFLGPMSGNIYIPALPTLQKAFNVSTTTINSTVSVFMAVFAIGPLIWGHFADICGRKWLYLCSLLLMTIVNILLASLPAKIGLLYFLRIFQAFSSSSVMSMGAGTVTDITAPKHRGKAIAYFMMGPNMGPIVAPIIAGVILINDNWRWLFGFTSIMSGVAFFLVLVFLPETLRCMVGNGDKRWIKHKNNNNNQYKNEKMAMKDNKSDLSAIESQTIQKDSNWQFFSNIGIQKPVTDDPTFQKLYPRPQKAGIHTYFSLLKYPPVLITSIGTALLFANYYAFSVTFSYYLQTQYGYSSFKTGLAYICPGVAMLIGSQTGGHLSDYIRARWIKTHENRRFPSEFRLYLQIWGIVINTAGCIGYGWTIQKHNSIIWSYVFAAMNAFGLTWCSNTTMTYLTELLARRAATAVALSTMFRNSAAAISSAIIMTLADKMGAGWCFTGLAFFNIISLIGIVYLIFNGNRWDDPPI
ncbi:hypothetical protein Kpol_1048p45 [Vanderwaltozyma polyspora DSM 70294]|uniref:Major facilitator superfamily (MFS) profile domain-containing protein n=1 Tax=Vanderwaltozyma polyspora (strain ATCC 22028 / DSM 70294 / BCRC 21397 / CBS 2163 / NBRC 10782 / NRRL Y-8283 / UCD 57-17) TaxID=436907 RepID=A7TGK7_VANPO|nr:uncharacterized protein Kpol_1048p45 [Vanderwaltozyma polyspora DSM 70294]EDO18614.1 hypothetical protein Kpol_1048p45 [Vanderwaltozyma polyspora DSM 70294]